MFTSIHCSKNGTVLPIYFGNNCHFFQIFINIIIIIERIVPDDYWLFISNGYA